MELRHIPLFHGVSSSFLDSITPIAEELDVRSGQTLFKLGAEATRFFVVLRGRVDLTLPLQILGVQQDGFVEEAGPGEMIGWSAFVAPHHYSMSARAAVDSALVALPGARVRELLAADPTAGFAVMSNLATLVARRLHRTQAMWVRELQRSVTSKLG